MKMWSTVCPQLCILFSSNTFYFTLTGRWWQEWFTRKDRSHRAEGKTLSYGLCRCCSVLMPFLWEICLQKSSHFFHAYEKKNKELMLKRCIGIAVICAKCRLTAPLSWGSHKYFAPLHFLSFASFSKHGKPGDRESEEKLEFEEPGASEDLKYVIWKQRHTCSVLLNLQPWADDKLCFMVQGEKGETGVAGHLGWAGTIVSVFHWSIRADGAFVRVKHIRMCHVTFFY